MKIWKQKALIPKLGYCTVKEYSDQEATDYKPPISHGFVVLYKDGKHVGWCGVNFAKKRTGKGRVEAMNEKRQFLRKVKKERAEIMLEAELWKVINEHAQKPPTHSESRLYREDIIHVLGQMVARVASELQGYAKR